MDYPALVRFWRWYIGRALGEELNQLDFAGLVKVVPSAVSQWETGRFRPGPESIAKIECIAAVDPGVFYRPPARSWTAWQRAEQRKAG
jgi:transcriptional regulator with XRE-family HTH domain